MELLRGDLTVVGEVEEREGFLQRVLRRHLRVRHRRREELVEGVGGSFSVKVILNPELEIGDFTIETAYGTTDGRVASRMDEVEQALAGEGEHV